MQVADGYIVINYRFSMRPVRFMQPLRTTITFRTTDSGVNFQHCTLDSHSGLRYLFSNVQLYADLESIKGTSALTCPYDLMSCCSRSMQSPCNNRV